MKNLFAGFGLLLLCITANAQQIAKGLTAANGQYIGFLEYKPTNYATDLSYKYPLIVFMHGIGERGNGTSQIWSVANGGIPRYIQQGNPMRFWWNGKLETFIVLSPQLSTSYGDWVDFYTEEMIKYAKANLRIDTNRIIVTGLSLGGGGAWRYSTSSLAHAQEIAAVAPVCGTCSAVNPANIANGNLPLWAFHALNDGVVGAGCTTSQVAGVQAANPVVKPIMTLFSSGGHGIWDWAYDSLYNVQNPNIYEWFLGQNKSLAPNILPVSNAGPNRTISTATGSINLSGVASSDADGNIVRYIWRKVSGPAAGNILTPVSTTGLTTVSNLNVAGTYVYELKVVDDRANWTTSNVTVTVTNSVVSNIPPVTSAGNNTVTTTTTASLNGTSSYDPDGSITSYQWTKVSGPALYTISNPNVASPDLSFLMLGDYAFELRSTDNNGASTTDTVIVRSSASILPVQWLYFNARNNGKENKLVWATEAEAYNRRFEVQRSVDGVNFETIGSVEGAGISITTQNYSFTDNFTGTGKTFYRLRQVSTDGKATYSTVAVINPAMNPKAVDHFPNPAKNILNVVIENKERGLVTLRVLSLDGKLRMHKQASKQDDIFNTTLLLQKLNSGVYILEVQMGNELKEVRKFVKQ
jgi:hypothetical protein